MNRRVNCSVRLSPTTRADCPGLQTNRSITSQQTRDIDTINVGPMLGQRRRRWINIGPTVCRCLVFAGMVVAVQKEKTTATRAKPTFVTLKQLWANVGLAQNRWGCSRKNRDRTVTKHRAIYSPHNRGSQPTKKQAMSQQRTTAD